MKEEVQLETQEIPLGLILQVQNLPEVIAQMSKYLKEKERLSLNLQTSRKQVLGWSDGGRVTPY